MSAFAETRIYGKRVVPALYFSSLKIPLRATIINSKNKRFVPRSDVLYFAIFSRSLILLENILCRILHRSLFVCVYCFSSIFLLYNLFYIYIILHNFKILLLYE